MPYLCKLQRNSTSNDLLDTQANPLFHFIFKYLSNREHRGSTKSRLMPLSLTGQVTVLVWICCEQTSFLRKCDTECRQDVGPRRSGFCMWHKLCLGGGYSLPIPLWCTSSVSKWTNTHQKLPHGRSSASPSCYSTETWFLGFGVVWGGRELTQGVSPRVCTCVCSGGHMLGDNF